MSKHTWIANKSQSNSWVSAIIFDHSGELIARLSALAGTPEEELRRRAHLIAAAPEMLEALKSIRRTLLAAGGDPMPTLDAVIAKAEDSQ